MRTARTKPSWIETNQAFLVAEFARLKKVLGLEGAAPPAVPALESPAAIDRLTGVFGLSSFEREILLLTAGIEMDSALAGQCRQVQGHSKPGITFGVAMAALSDPHWSALTPTAALRRYRLVEIESGYGITCAPLRIDERILHYLAGINLLDSRLQPLLRLSPEPEWIAEDHRRKAELAAAALGRAAEPPPVIHFCGGDSYGHKDAAASAATAIGRQLYTVRADELPAPGPELEQFALLWERESMLLPGALFIQADSSEIPQAARNLAERLPGFVLLGSREPVNLDRALLRFDVDKPRPAEQKRLWENALGPAATGMNGLLDDVAQQFRFSARTIFSTGALASKGKAPLSSAELWNLCRSVGRPRLENLAQRLTPSAGWDDLALPEPQMSVLRHLAAQAKHRMQVYETWQFSAKGHRGLGVSALFAGDSGTGKTLAAEVLAHELALDLYRIDLSAVVSKYIGETEKNLKQVFDAAEEGGGLLLFDEADALFGKRADVKDSHDRYANIEVGYLLQRMEAYQGVAILTTNLKSSLDRAFQRRLRFTVTFPFPDAAQREAIWQRAFPSDTPVCDLNFKKLAQLNVTGGNISNIALNAAFLAAAAGTPVDMAHLLEAAKLEAQKIERPLSDAETRGWV